MMAREDDSNQLRCFCARRPLLATYGITDKGELFIHVKVWKQRRLYGDIKVLGGKVELICRECFRSHSVIIRQPNRAALKEVTDPLPSV